jgi:hypothetical protein
LKRRYPELKHFELKIEKEFWGFGPRSGLSRVVAILGTLGLGYYDGNSVQLFGMKEEVFEVQNVFHSLV